MKALFLGGVAAGTAAGIKDRLPAHLEVEILDDPIDRTRLLHAAADAATRSAARARSLNTLSW